jgi:hypothetical protein
MVGIIIVGKAIDEAFGAFSAMFCWAELKGKAGRRDMEGITEKQHRHPQQ